MEVDPAVVATVGISVGTLLLGMVLGVLVSRRGRRLRVDWRLTVETDNTPPPEALPAPEPDDGEGS